MNECSSELSAMTMYIYKLQSNISALLLLFILFVTLVVACLFLLAAINEKLRIRQHKEQESEND